MGQSKKTVKAALNAVVVVAVAAFMSACGNKDNGGGSNQNNNGPVSAACVGCPAGLGLIASGVARSYLAFSNTIEAEMSMQLYGDSSAIGTAGQTVSNYQGKVVVGGTLRVRQARTGSCNIPVGDYSLTTTQAGTWSGQSFGGINVTANGPVQLQMVLQTGVIFGAAPAIVDLAGAQFPYKVIILPTYIASSSSGGACNMYSNQFYFSYF